MPLDNLPSQSQEHAPAYTNALQLVAPLLISASTLLGVSTVLHSSPAHAQEHRQLSEREKERIKETVKKELPTAPMSQLLTWMDSTIYDVRTFSTDEFYNRSAKIFEETGKFPEEVRDFLDNKRSFPPEVRRRLQTLSHKFAELEQVRMLSGSNIKFPKTEMTVRDWLACISKQIERPVNFYGEVKYNNEIIQTKDGLFWDVIANAKLKDGQQFVYYSASPTEVNLHIGKREGRLIATNGAISVQLDTEIGDFRYVVEPKVDTQSFYVTAIRQRDEKGEMHSSSFAGGKRASLPIYVKPGKPFYAEVDIEVRAYRMKKVDVENPKQPTTVSVGGWQYEYTGIAPKTDELGHHLATLVPQKDCPSSYLQKTKCAAFDQKGEGHHIPSIHQTQDDVTWSFGKTQPEKVSLYIPLDHPSDSVPPRKITLVFKRE